MLLVTQERQEVKLMNLETEKFEVLQINARCTVAKWHPRTPSKILIGTATGQIMLFDLEKRKVEQEYACFTKEDRNVVVDLSWSPGEDVFLALFQQGQLRLYA